MKNNRCTKTPRAGEYVVFASRSQRYFEQESYWYFRTREGIDIGPFDSKLQAKQGVAGFINFLKEVSADVVVRINEYVRGQTRRGESDVPGCRTDRIFEQNSYWYFRTREGTDFGPFDNRGRAVIGAKGFIDFLQQSQPEIVNRVTGHLRMAPYNN